MQRGLGERKPPLALCLKTGWMFPLSVLIERSAKERNVLETIIPCRISMGSVIEPPHPKRDGDSQAQPWATVISMGVTFPRTVRVAWP
ncbi:MAG: hypothetical protein F6K56_06875 [Moorea sp. SIO3G5]|nr:hypothetical protein [Moorena sp. SIO3G5]